MAEYQFRKAVMGGFNCEDVMGFVTGMAEKHQAELAEQVSKNQALEQELESRREELSALRAELERTARERDEWKARAEQAEELAQKKLGGELERLRAEVERLTPAAEAYAAVKERTAGIEFEAHRRAQNVESRAKIAAGDILRQAGQWMTELERQYDALKVQIEHSATQAAAHIAAAGEGMEQVSRLLEQQKTALKAVSDSCTESLKGKRAE